MKKEIQKYSRKRKMYCAVRVECNGVNVADSIGIYERDTKFDG